MGGYPEVMVMIGMVATTKTGRKTGVMMAHGEVTAMVRMVVWAWRRGRDAGDPGDGGGRGTGEGRGDESGATMAPSYPDISAWTSA